MYPSWENVSHKALKLATQLKATLTCMNAFIDALQTVADSANNIKGRYFFVFLRIYFFLCSL